MVARFEVLCYSISVVKNSFFFGLAGRNLNKRDEK